MDVAFLLSGLDPAQPCFRTVDDTERLDATDADYVDIIHTNGRLLSKIGFGFPERTGKAFSVPTNLGSVIQLLLFMVNESGTTILDKVSKFLGHLKSSFCLRLRPHGCQFGHMDVRDYNMYTR